ncbi:hypothetical protein [Luteimonas sp. MC1825]|uniref:hypothetical protein n=1 Tax=Luteimonas sp. MC1825 TaxID=2761107 RepID=UPI001622EBAB|nr:hypothetical protein [Luteimonas sp. MC1825]MBB6599039.1 hypothetical protein [Luteimonas sp. MC1825]QOC89172.1 hypothetical protein IDM46_05480 [Luteimonas sp. MC1825]
MKTTLLFTVALATAFSAPVLAQGAGATLRIDSGSAMVSTGGEFATASSGAQLSSGSRVMLGEGSRSTLVYTNGCTQALNNPGVYSVSATCVAANGAGGSNGAGRAGVDVGGAAIITGVTVAAAAALASMDDVEYVAPPPVSR